MTRLSSSALRLAAVCAVTALLLGGVDALTAPAIAARREVDLSRAIAAVAPGLRPGPGRPVSDGTEVTQHYVLTDSRGRPAGHVVRLVSEGYAGEIVTIAAYAANGELRAARVVENVETPGLGKTIEGPSYMARFVGLGGGRAIPTGKADLPERERDRVSGATQSFSAVARALAAGSAFVKALGGGS